MNTVPMQISGWNKSTTTVSDRLG